MAEKLVLSQALFGSEQNPTPVDLAPLFRLAQLSEIWWKEYENSYEEETGKPWTGYNSAINYYDSYYASVSRRHEDNSSEGIIERLNSIRQEKGQVVCLFVGTGDNPVENFTRTMNKNAEGPQKPVVVITVGLQDRLGERKQAEEQKGHYDITGTIGTPKFFEDLQALLTRLHSEGVIAAPYVDAMVTRIMMGMLSIPFGEQVDDLLIRTTSAYSYMRYHEDARQEAIAIKRLLKSISDSKRRALYNAYRRWMVDSFEKVLDPQQCVIWGEIPYEMKAVLSQKVRRETPFETRTQQGTVALSLNEEIKAEGVMGVFRLDKSR